MILPHLGIRDQLIYYLLLLKLKVEYCSKVNLKKTYFPYATFKCNENKFKGKLEKDFPGLSLQRPDLFSYLVGIQHFGVNGFRWLPSFMDLNNENKHQRLVPQLKREFRELHIKGVSGQVELIMEEGALIELELGAIVDIGGAQILGNQLVSVNNMPKIAE